MSAPLIAPTPLRSRRRDRRYRIAREYCGAARPQHIARFCGEWIGFAPNRAAARDIVVAHRAARDAILNGEAQ